jgi:hypothetical protein
VTSLVKGAALDVRGELPRTSVVCIGVTIQEESAFWFGTLKHMERKTTTSANATFRIDFLSLGRLAGTGLLSVIEVTYSMILMLFRSQHCLDSIQT